MYIDRLEVHYNTMIKHTAHITQTLYTVILKCININLKKQYYSQHIYRYIVINNYILRMLLHQAHNLLNNGVALSLIGCLNS